MPAIARAMAALCACIGRVFGCCSGTLEIRSASEEVTTGFAVQPMCWVVKRTHPWIERNRRLIAHQDRSDWAAIAWAWPAQSRRLATRLAN